jgi:hypothetical protein
VEDRIRNTKDAGLRSLPLRGFAQNQLWCELAALAGDLLAWIQMLALDGSASRWNQRNYGSGCPPPSAVWPAAAANPAPIDDSWPWAPDPQARSPTSVSVLSFAPWRPFP